MLVRNVMRRDLVTVGPMVPLLEAGTVVAMLSDREIVVRGLSEQMQSNHATVRDVMYEDSAPPSRGARLGDAEVTNPAWRCPSGSGPCRP